MKIIRDRHYVEVTKYDLIYKWNDCPGAGFGFDCDAKGNVDIEAMNPAARENYEKCKSGEYDVRLIGVTSYDNSYWEPAVGLCNHCGSEVHLDGFTNTCEKCETDYNMSGQELAPREYWGEETGEHWSDCL